MVPGESGCFCKRAWACFGTQPSGVAYMDLMLCLWDSSLARRRRSLKNYYKIHNASDMCDDADTGIIIDSPFSRKMHSASRGQKIGFDQPNYDASFAIH